MHTTVLRGDWEKLCRRGDRVWVRVRPHEVVWKTAADLNVAEIRSIAIAPIQREVMRRSRVPGRGDTRVARSPITRVVITYGVSDEVTIAVHETEAVVVGAFADLHDRFVAEADEVDIDLVEEARLDAEPDDLPYISWKPASPAVAARDPESLVAVAAHHDPELARDVSFKLELGAHPEAVGHWLDTRVNGGNDADPFPSSDDELFGDDEVPESGGVLERRKRRLRHKLRGSGARTSR